MNKFIIIGILLFFISILFIGINKKSDSPEASIFIKSTASLNMVHVPEIKNSQVTLEELTQQLKEKDESSENNVSNFLPYLLIQLTLTFLFLGIYKVRFTSKFEKWLFPLHFIINFFITTFIIGGMLVSDNIFVTIALSLVTLFVNYFSIYKIKNKSFFNSPPAKNVIKDTIAENNNS